jgi:hypothetical protein
LSIHTRSGKPYVFTHIESGKHTGRCKRRGGVLFENYSTVLSYISIS